MNERQKHLAYLLVEANKILAVQLFPARIDQLSATAECRLLRLCIRYDDADGPNAQHFHTFVAAQFAAPETIAAAAYTHFLVGRNMFTATDCFGEDIADAMPEGVEFSPISQVATVRIPQTESCCPVYIEIDDDELPGDAPLGGAPSKAGGGFVN